MRRESVNQVEQTQVRLRQEINDTNAQTIQRTTDKLERLRDEFEYKAKDIEKVMHEDVLRFFFQRDSLEEKKTLSIENLSNRISKSKMNNDNDNYKPFKATSNNKWMY